MSGEPSQTLLYTTTSNNDVDPNSASNAHELQKWLRSSTKWTDDLLSGWRPIKNLGRGGNGAAGLWRWDSTPDPSVLSKEERKAAGMGEMTQEEWENARMPRPGSLESYVREVVVKQSIDLRREAAVMEMLNTTGSTHVPELYARVQRAVDLGPHKEVGPKGKEVQRLVMEYLPGGNLLNMTENENTWFHGKERQLWSVFVCLAKAVAVMETGEEMPEGKGLKGWNSVTHGDLMAKNVFVDKFPEDGEHMLAARIAVGNFGASTLRDGFPREKKVSERESVKITADEQKKKRKKKIDTILFELECLNEPDNELMDQERKKKECRLERDLHELQMEADKPEGPPLVEGNVWAVGRTMAILIGGNDQEAEGQFEAHYSHIGNGWKDFQRQFRMDRKEKKLSKKLETAVLLCLQPDPRARPTPADLVKLTLSGLKTVDEVAMRATDQTLARSRSRLRMVKEGEKRIWESDWMNSELLPELRRFKEGLPNYGEYDQLKATREMYKRQG